MSFVHTANVCSECHKTFLNRPTQIKHGAWMLIIQTFEAPYFKLLLDYPLVIRSMYPYERRYYVKKDSVKFQENMQKHLEQKIPMTYFKRQQMVGHSWTFLSAPCSASTTCICEHGKCSLTCIKLCFSVDSSFAHCVVEGSGNTV